MKVLSFLLDDFRIFDVVYVAAGKKRAQDNQYHNSAQKKGGLYFLLNNK